jgi:hypothetical protein
MPVASYYTDWATAVPQNVLYNYLFRNRRNEIMEALRSCETHGIRVCAAEWK